MRPRPVRCLLGAALVAVLAVLPAACSAGAGNVSGGAYTAPGAGGGSASPGGTALTVGMTAEPANLDFTTMDGAAIPQALLTNVYEGLVKLDDEGRIVPGLARSWTVSPDRRTYTFTLVEDATFTNGAPFTAQDAVFSIDRVKTDWTTSLAEAMDVVQSARATSPTTLVVTLARPSNDWLYRMTTRIGAMFSRTGVDDLATSTVGTGPYTLGRWNPGDSLVLERNPRYWAARPYFDTVTLRYFKVPTALNNALLTGTIDVIQNVQAPESLAQFEGNESFRIIQGVTNGEVVLAMNNARPPFDDVRVRRAVRAAIDHDLLLDTCWAGRGTLIGSMVPPTDPWYRDLTGIAPHDPAAARRLLAQADTPNPSVRLRLPTLPYATACGQVVKSQLEQVGFRVALDQLEFPAGWLTTVLKGGDYEMSIVAHVEPRDLGAVFGNPDYYIHYRNPELDAALAAADAGDEQAQVENMAEAARIISTDAASDWLFLLPNLMVATKDITGLDENAVSESFDLTGIARAPGSTSPTS